MMDTHRLKVDVVTIPVAPLSDSRVRVPPQQPVPKAVRPPSNQFNHYPARLMRSSGVNYEGTVSATLRESSMGDGSTLTREQTTKVVVLLPPQYCTGCGSACGLGTPLDRELKLDAGELFAMTSGGHQGVVDGDTFFPQKRVEVSVPQCLGLLVIYVLTMDK